jgi:hypothetical protein
MSIGDERHLLKLLAARVGVVMLAESRLTISDSLYKERII